MEPLAQVKCVQEYLYKQTRDFLYCAYIEYFRDVISMLQKKRRRVMTEK